MMRWKEMVHQQCILLLQEKIDRLKRNLDELRDSASNETKSTAGDKHETALAMLQIEQKNATAQLANLLAQKAILDKIRPKQQNNVIGIGTLITTDKAVFYLSIALGKIDVGDKIIIALSPQSPLGSMFTSGKINDSISFNGATYVIKEIV